MKIERKKCQSGGGLENIQLLYHYVKINAYVSQKYTKKQNKTKKQGNKTIIGKLLYKKHRFLQTICQVWWSSSIF